MSESKITLERDGVSGLTCVPNLFIDKYMAKAPGEYVKVYLYLLRCLGGQSGDFSLEQMALLFDSTEGEIRRAVVYWEKEGLLRLTYHEGRLSCISIGMGQDSRAEEEKKAGDAVPFAQEVPNYSIKEISHFLENEEIRQLQFVAESYLGRPLTQKDVSYLLVWNKSLGFSPDLAIRLMEVEVSEGHLSFREMNHTAIRWYQGGIRTPEDVKNRHRSAQKEKLLRELGGDIREALHMEERDFSDSERSFLSKWEKKWHFSAELILEACRRTFANTGQASFAYADKVLYNWHRKNISTMDEVARSDEQFQKRSTFASSSRRTADRGASSLPAFKGRKSNYSELENLLLAGG